MSRVSNRKCSNCKEWFTALGARQFCSSGCRTEHFRVQNTSVRICQNCNKSYGISSGWSVGKFNLSKFCSRDCRIRFITGINHHNYKEPLTFVCLYCKQTYTKQPCFEETSKYCCKVCKDADLDMNLTSEDFRARNCKEYKDWRKAVLERDDYTCQHCSITGVPLFADHVEPFSLYPQLRYEISNGRTLCFCCHSKTDTFGGKMKQYVKDLALSC